LEADLLAGQAAFEPCFRGASVVFHTASPFLTANVTNPLTQLVAPAVQGTLAVMAAAAAAGTVRRVVLTSSVAAVRSAKDPRVGYCFSEGDWNTLSSIDGGDAMDHYQYSKTAAEREAWAFVGSPAGVASGLELATVLPSFLVGPPRTARVDSESLANMAAVLRGEVGAIELESVRACFMRGAFIRSVHVAKRSLREPSLNRRAFAIVSFSKVPPRGDTAMADVRDVAKAHLAAAFTPNAKGQRFIVSTTAAVTRDAVLLAAQAALPQVLVAAPAGPPVAPAAPAAAPIFCSKTFGLLGLELTRPEASLAEMATAMLALGAVAPKLRSDSGAELREL
jgi:nucleoside-diphosphate-sugar epimerase